MKFFRLIYLVLIVGLFSTGCGGDDPFSVLLDVEPPEHIEQLAVHCFISDDNEFIFAGLSETRALLDISEELDAIDNGSISLYQDGEKLFDFDVFPAQANNIMNYRYTVGEQFGLRQGEFELRASAPGFPELVATQSFPTKVSLTEVTFEEDGTIDFEGTRLDAVEITFTDPAGEENFYEISLVSRDSSCLSGSVSFSAEYFETQDLNAEESADFNSMLLTDASFDGSEYRIILGVNNFVEEDRDLLVQWKCISKEHYQYSRSLNAFRNGDDFGGFSEPIPIFSNVDNGIGIFTCFTNELISVVDNEQTIDPNPDLVSGTIGGELFEPCEIGAWLDYNGTSFSLNGNDNQRWINIFINDLDIGEFDAADESFFINFFDDNSQSNFFLRDGILEIIEFDEEEQFISGVFNGTLEDLYNITTIEVMDLIFEVTYEN